MAGRILNRRALREQTEEAEQSPAVITDLVPVVAPPKRLPKAKAATPKVRKPRAKKAPPRMRVRWGVFDSGLKQVAIFDYPLRAAAEEKVADLLAKKKGNYFLQPVKEPMPEPAPAEATAAK